MERLDPSSEQTDNGEENYAGLLQEPIKGHRRLHTAIDSGKIYSQCIPSINNQTSH